MSRLSEKKDDFQDCVCRCGQLYGGLDRLRILLCGWMDAQVNTLIQCAHCLHWIDLEREEMKASDSARQMEWARFMAGLSPDYTVNRINKEPLVEAEDRKWKRSHLSCMRAMMILALPSAIFLGLFVYGVYCGVMVIAQHLDRMK